ncbi:MAG: class I SAM-dependent methyltransferase [Caldilineaceae bacterium]
MGARPGTASRPVYLRRQDPAWDRVSYRLWSPPNELGLLGPVAGRRVLDLGCGGGHNARLALKSGKARVTGVDGSATMTATAQQQLTARVWTQHSSTPICGPTRRPAGGAAWDVVLSVATLPCVEDAASVFCVPHGCSHPADEEAGLQPRPSPAQLLLRRRGRGADGHAGGDYATSMSWVGPSPRRTSNAAVHRPVATWCDLVTAAGLRLLRLVEPRRPPPSWTRRQPGGGRRAGAAAPCAPGAHRRRCQTGRRTTDFHSYRVRRYHAPRL